MKLKADAIKNSILPKLEIINNHTIATISEVYQINPLELSTVLKFPSFRKNRTTGFKIESHLREPDCFAAIFSFDKAPVHYCQKLSGKAGFFADPFA